MNLTDVQGYVTVAAHGRIERISLVTTLTLVRYLKTERWLPEVARWVDVGYVPIPHDYDEQTIESLIMAAVSTYMAQSS